MHQPPHGTKRWSIRRGQHRVEIVLGLMLVVGIIWLGGILMYGPDPGAGQDQQAKGAGAAAQSKDNDDQFKGPALGPRRRFALPPRPGGEQYVIHWWDRIPKDVREASLKPGKLSNIRGQDHAGAESCRKCHTEQYNTWASHPHRWMYTAAEPQTVKGEFSDTAAIEYLGGRVAFYREDGRYRMRLSRGSSRRTYEVRGTIGSRVLQYYVGRQIEGPESAGHRIRKDDHVLPFGYWISRQQWVPAVHLVHDLTTGVRNSLPDDQQSDPYSDPSRTDYAVDCSLCHLTRPAGDLLVRRGGLERAEALSPHPQSFLLSAYLAQTRPKLVPPDKPVSSFTDDEYRKVVESLRKPAGVESALVLGIDCEACHYGCQQHVAKSQPGKTSQKPLYYSASPHLYVKGKDRDTIGGRTPENLNWGCARCHSDGRPKFAGRMSTWHSAEYIDAITGSCYDPKQADETGNKQLTCVHCHDPHKPIGTRWSAAPQDDDARCIDCHQQYRDTATRTAHTHHDADSTGSRCMNCHMPRLTEGLQDVVRTHTIFSPTNTEMIESNQPNACNLCHLDKSIDWTTGFLSSWYGGDLLAFSESKLNENYTDRKGPVGTGWLKSPHRATRLAATDALTREKARWALPELLEALDDPYLINRQFVQKGLEDMLGIRLEDEGYRFFMQPTQRQTAIDGLKGKLLSQPPPPTGDP